MTKLERKIKFRNYHLSCLGGLNYLVDVLLRIKLPDHLPQYDSGISNVGSRVSSQISQSLLVSPGTCMLTFEEIGVHAHFQLGHWHH